MQPQKFMRVLALLLPLTVPVSVSAIDLTPEELAFIAEHPTVVVGGEVDWPPMDFVEDGVYQGAATANQQLQDLTQSRQVLCRSAHVEGFKRAQANNWELFARGRNYPGQHIAFHGTVNLRS